MKIFKIGLLVSVALMLVACGGGGGSSTATTVTPTAPDSGNAAVTVNLAADYGSGSSFAGLDDSRSSIPSVLSFCLGTASDNPGYVAGMDCDSDGGVVAYVDPTGFKVAIKRLALVMSDNTKVDLIADTGTLANAEVLDLANPVELNISEIPKGVYSGFYAELYYYDLTMPLYSTTDSEIRVMLSDDDFPAEGSLGNHQGDVKLKNGAGDFNFVAAGLTWVESNLDVVRPSDIGGASSDDTETGHDRGLYGNDDLWNLTQFMQGADQDIFVNEASLGLSGITVGDAGGTITMTFDLNDSWYYEDFDANGIFEPCSGGGGLEACSAGAEWSPVFPGISFSLSN
ncbi:MAG: hypothetical protein C0603_03970 [Denitrovibrio sp.]|nr:MAG: hypothetical protein C0603_03970 [Denitrovibrio sp.]